VEAHSSEGHRLPLLGQPLALVGNVLFRLDREPKRGGGRKVHACRTGGGDD